MCKQILNNWKIKKLQNSNPLSNCARTNLLIPLCDFLLFSKKKKKIKRYDKYYNRLAIWHNLKRKNRFLFSIIKTQWEQWKAVKKHGANSSHELCSYIQKRKIPKKKQKCSLKNQKNFDFFVNSLNRDFF